MQCHTTATSQTQLTMACHPAFDIYMLPKRKATSPANLGPRMHTSIKLYKDST